MGRKGPAGLVEQREPAQSLDLRHVVGVVA
jgi:hypothetical protein